MAVYSLIAERGEAVGKAIGVEIVSFQLAGGAIITPDDIRVTGQDDKDVKHSARRGAWVAYQELAKLHGIGSKSVIARSGVAFDFAGNTFNHISGPSAGLCFFARMAQRLIEDHLQAKGRPVPHHDFAATGTLSGVPDDKVHAVEAIEAKLSAALAVLPKDGIVFYPEANDPLDAALHQEAQRREITLIAVDTPRRVIECLLARYGVSDWADRPKPRKRWLIRVLAVLFTVALVWWISSWLPLVPSPQPLPVTSISVKAALFYEGKNSSVVPLSTGKALTQGDGIRIRLEVDRECFLYVFEVDGGNYIAWLFPSTPYSQPLPGTERWIPQDDQWIELDDVKGEEVVLVFATTDPSPVLEGMRPSIAASKDMPNSERLELRTKLVGYLEGQQKERLGTLVRLPFQHE